MSLHLVVSSTPAAGVLLPLVTETEVPSSSLSSPTELILLLLREAKVVKMSVVVGGRDRGTGKVLSGYGVTKQKSKLALTRSDF